MVFKNANEPTFSFNFIRVYVEAMKNIPIKGYYNFDKVLDFITETIAVLYNLAIYNLFQKPRAYLESGNRVPANEETNQIRAYL